MYQLFTKRFDSANSVIRPPSFELIRRIYQREIEKIEEYYKSRVIATKSNHLLCRILTTGNIPLQYEISRYMEVAYSRLPYVAKYFNLTSEIEYGRFHDGVFYGPKVKELLIYHEEYFNPYEAVDNWKNVRAIKVLEHPISDFGLKIPDGREQSTASGTAVLAINLPLLFAQYKGFVRQQAIRIDNGELGQLAVTHFIHMYVLPQILESHIEIVILNRLKNIYYGAPMSEKTRAYPFVVMDYSDKVDNVLDIILRHIQDSKTYYYTYLKNIPSIFDTDMQVSLQMPDLAKTRQVWWAMLYSRLDTIKFLIDVGGKEGISFNRGYIGKFQLDAKRLMSEGTLNSILSRDESHDANDFFETVLEL